MSQQPSPANATHYRYGNDHTIKSEYVSPLELLEPRRLLSAHEASLLEVDAAGKNNSAANVAFNPFVWAGGHNVLVNVKANVCDARLPFTCGPKANNARVHGEEYVAAHFPGISRTNIAWLWRPPHAEHARHAAVLRRTLVDAEDIRVVQLRGETLALFVRYRAHKRKDIWLARLDPEPYYEVKVNLADRRSSEGNWLPFVHGHQLYASYSICPHRVLAIEPRSGNATVAYDTPKASGCKGYERGSSPGFVWHGERGEPDGTVVGLGHGKGTGNGNFYWHFFWRRQAAPPFAMLARSDDFRLPTYFTPYSRAPMCCGNGDRWVKGSLWSIALDFTQYCTSMRPGRNGTDELGRDLILDYAAADRMPLSLHVPRAVFCDFTGWCNATSSAALPPSHATDLTSSLAMSALALPSSSSSERSAGPPPGRRRFAVVIKGPLLPFTEDVIGFYANHLHGANTQHTVLVFSHNSGPCLKKQTETRLDALVREHDGFFAYVLHPPPRLEGSGHRNVQREACFYGVKFALERYRVEYVLMQRDDLVFLRAAPLLPELARLHEAQPPPSVPLPAGRLGICPMQLQFSAQYGQFHLDDHCMFGRPRALLDYWNVSNAFYRPEITNRGGWSTPLGNARLHCPSPATESDNGFIWVADHARRGVAAPASTKQLIEQRMWVLNPDAWEYLSRRKHANKHLDLEAFNLSAAPGLSVLRFEVQNASAPYGAARLCERRGLSLDCSGVGDEVWGRRDSARWACSAGNTNC